MDAVKVAKAFLALTLVITLQGCVKTQDSLCPLEPVVVHLSRGQKVTISYHMSEGIEQDIVQLPKITRRPFGPSRTTTPLTSSDGLDPYERASTTPPSATLPPKDDNNVTDVISTTFESGNREGTETSQPPVVTTESSTEKVVYSGVSNISTQVDDTTEFNNLTSTSVNDYIATTEPYIDLSSFSQVTDEESPTTIGAIDFSSETELPSTTIKEIDVKSQTEETLISSTENNTVIPSSTSEPVSSTLVAKQDEVTVNLIEQTSSSTVAPEVEQSPSSTVVPEVKQSPSSTVAPEAVSTTQSTPVDESTIDISRESIKTTTESTITESTASSEPTLSDELSRTTENEVEGKQDEDKAEEVTDKIEELPQIENQDDFGGEVEDDENVTSTTVIQSTTVGVTESSTSNSPVSTTLIEEMDKNNTVNTLSEIELNSTTIEDKEITTPLPTSDIVNNDLTSTTISDKTTQVNEFSSVPLDAFEKSLLANLTTLITETHATTGNDKKLIGDNDKNLTTDEDNKKSTTENQEFELKETVSTDVSVDKSSEKPELSTTIITITGVTNTDTDDDEEEEEADEEEEERNDEDSTVDNSLLQSILEQVLVDNNNETDDSRGSRDIEEETSDLENAQQEEEIDGEGDGEVAHADDTHSLSDEEVPFGSRRGPDFVDPTNQYLRHSFETIEDVRSERERRDLRYLVHPNITKCEWRFKTDPGVPLLLSFKNYSIPVSERCEDHHIAVKRTNGYVARWCGKAKESPSHTTFARQELHLLLYSENGPAETGFVAEIQALDTFLLRKAVNKVRPLFSAPH